MQSAHPTASAEPQLVVLIAGTISIRAGKVGYALKSLGWRVVLLYSNFSYIEGFNRCFDEMHHYGSAEEALEMAGRYRPLVYHVFAVWDYSVAIRMIQGGVGPLVLDNYDHIGGMLKPEFMESRYPGIFERERFCIENADALSCRDFQPAEARRAMKYRRNGKTIFFPEYCWGSGVCGVDDAPSGYREAELRVVYAGGLNVEKRDRGDQYLMQFKNGYFLDFGKDLASAGIHFHLYPAQNSHSPQEFENVFSEYLEAQEASPYFHLHRSVPEEQLVREISRYDLGIEATWLETERIGSEHALPVRNRCGMSNKCFSYLDAGLGMILSENFTMRHWMFARHGIVRTAYLDFVKPMLLNTPTDFYRNLRARAVRARESLTVTRHAPRLADFYLAASNTRNRAVFHLPTTASPERERPLCLFLDTCEQPLMERIYVENPGMASLPYAEQLRSLEAAGVGGSGGDAAAMTDAGWRADHLMVNCRQLQLAWARERRLSSTDLMRIMLEQVREMRPAVVFLNDPFIATDDITRALRQLSRVMAIRVEGEFPRHVAPTAFDIVFTASPPLAERLSQEGVPCLCLSPALDPAPARTAPSYRDRIIKAALVADASVSRTSASEFLDTLAQRTPVLYCGTGEAPGAEGQGDGSDGELLHVVNNARITVLYGEGAGDPRRLYQATGAGSLVLTDQPDAGELFDVGREIVAYRSPEECARLVGYYLTHPDEAEAIVRAGRERTLQQHGHAARMAQVAGLLEGHLRAVAEKP